MTKVLLVEDDQPLAESLTAALHQHSYLVDWVGDGQSGLDLVMAFEYDVIVLDWLLPRVDGIGFCQQLRRQHNDTPVLLLTAQDEVAKKAIGLDAGADDYLVKPFEVKELLARLRALLRRGRLASAPILAWGDLRLDPVNVRVTYRDEVVALSTKEYSLLALLLRQGQRIFSHSALLDRLWAAGDAPTQETVRAHVKSLRRKLRRVGVEDVIQTVYGLGYRLRDQADFSPAAPVPRLNSASWIDALRLSSEGMGDPGEDVETQAPAVLDPSQISAGVPTEFAAMWAVYYQKYRDRLQLIEQAVTMLRAGTLNPMQLQRAAREAHTLAGSLGSFGLDQASQWARQIEQMLAPGMGLEADFVRDLPELERRLAAVRQQIEQARPESHAPEPATPRPPGSKHLLIVDDDEALAKQFAATAIAHHLHATVALDVPQARAAIAAHRPDAILLDLSFSDSAADGFSLLETVAEQHPELPVIVVTGQTGFAERVRVARLHGRGFLQKPIAPSQAIAAVCQALSQSQDTDATIVVVESDPQVLDQIQTILAPWGFHLSLLASAPQLWAALGQPNRRSPDLLILSTDLPEVSGIELCQVMRNDPNWGNLPILLLSNHVDPQTVDQLFAAGADDYVQKPIIGSALVARVLNRLERVRRRQSDALASGPIAPSVSTALSAVPPTQGTDRWVQLYQVVTTLAPVGIYRADLAGNCLYVNERWAEITGISVQQALADGWVQALHYEDRDRVFAEWHQLVQHGMPFQSEYRMQRPDGKVTWVLGQAVAETDGRDRRTGYVGTITDLTARKQTEAALRESETALKTATLELEQRVAERTLELSHMNTRLAAELQERKRTSATLRETERRWRTLLENVRLVVVGLDAQAQVNYANPFFLELTGYALDEVLGHKWFGKFQPADRHPQGLGDVQDLLEHNFHSHHENVILTKTGEERLIAWNNTLLKDDQEHAIGTLSIGEDITERTLIARLKDEFVSVVSHELRTPLTSIHGALNLLSEGLVPPQSQRAQRVIEIAAAGADRLVHLVNDILDLERLESGQFRLVIQVCQLPDLMQQAADLMQLTAQQAGVALMLVPLALSLEADGDRLIQVLTNLIGNAIKFSPPGGTVWVTAEIFPANTLKITIADQGRGIPTDMLLPIFERFQQVDVSDARGKGGTGLGLAICRSIVQQHGGEIWAESAGGEGSQFHITLPLNAHSAEPSSPRFFTKIAGASIYDSHDDSQNPRY